MNSLSTHLPALLVLTPLLSAPLVVILRRANLVRAVVGLVGIAQLFFAIALVRRVLVSGAVSYHVGGWPPPWGIELYVDALGGLVVLLLAMMNALVIPYMWLSSRKDINPEKQHVFYALVLLCIAGLFGMTVTGDAFNVFVFLEISALATYGLMSLGKNRQALTAALRYLILGTTGSTFFLLGLGLLLMATGTLNMQDIADKLGTLGHSRTVLAALAFITVGLGLKLAVFPLHVWLPDAYTYAPASVTALIAGTSTKVSFYVFCRFLFTVFGTEISFGQVGLEKALLAVGIAGMLAASLAAFFQTDVKRMLAYSSVAQLGYMVLGIGLNNSEGLTGSMVHLFNHAVMKTALFMAVGGYAYRLGSTRLKDLSGLGRRMPYTSAAFVIAGLSLIGVPLTVGFISKWYLVLGALQVHFLLAVAILVSSLLAVAYIWKVVEILYFTKAPDSIAQTEELPAGMLMPLWIMTALAVGFGIQTSTTIGLAQLAVTGLGVAP